MKNRVILQSGKKYILVLLPTGARLLLPCSCLIDMALASDRPATREHGHSRESRWETERTQCVHSTKIHFWIGNNKRNLN